MISTGLLGTPGRRIDCTAVLGRYHAVRHTWASTSSYRSAAFVAWATSKEYTQLVAEKQGWRAAPPGTRTSLYENSTYLEEAPLATLTKQTMDAATPERTLRCGEPTDSTL